VVKEKAGDRMRKSTAAEETVEKPDASQSVEEDIKEAIEEAKKEVKKIPEGEE